MARDFTAEFLNDTHAVVAKPAAGFGGSIDASVAGVSTDRNYSDVAEVPKQSRFVEVNMSLMALILAAIAVAVLLAALYRRRGGSRPH